MSSDYDSGKDRAYNNVYCRHWRPLYGAAIGDICGSIYEFNNRKTDKPEEIELINPCCFFTDDTVLTAAVASVVRDKRLHHIYSTGEWRCQRDEEEEFVGNDFERWFRKESNAYINGEKKSLDYHVALQEWANRYPDESYGDGFRRWFETNSEETRESYGNGAAMRISPVAQAINAQCGPNSGGGLGGDMYVWFYDAFLLYEVVRATVPSHNHPEAIRGAQCVACAIRNACYSDRDNYAGKQLVRDAIENKFEYNLSQAWGLRFGYEIPKLSEIRKDYKFDETCQGTVPVALAAFFESHDFVSAIQNAISVGGDSDTIAAITGSIAEAYYPIPKELKAFARSKLPGDIRRALGMERYDLQTGQIIAVD